MKKVYWLIILVLILAIGWYLVSPAFIDVELYEESPVFIDNMASMSESELEKFNQAVEESQEENNELEEDMEGVLVILSESPFEASAHEVEGSAQLIQTGDILVLRFEDFDSINGPDLHVYLSSSLGIEDAIDLGELKANKGSFNYELDGSIETDTYNNILVWCDPFGVLFSYAIL
jgi:hypothetical protein